METPKSIINDQVNYKPNAWQEYTISELGQWVHLFVKRAGMRDNEEMRRKDLSAAQAYLDMMQSHIHAA